MNMPMRGALHLDPGTAVREGEGFNPRAEGGGRTAPDPNDPMAVRLQELEDKYIQKYKGGDQEAMTDDEEAELEMLRAKQEEMGDAGYSDDPEMSPIMGVGGNYEPEGY